VWLALALVILQSALWILFISVPAVPLLGLGKLTGLDMPRVATVIYAFALNFFGITIVLLAAIGIAVARTAKAAAADVEVSRAVESGRSEQEILKRTAAAMPRLIVHRYIVAAIIAAALFNVALTLTGNNRGEFFNTNIYTALAIGLVVTLASFGLYAVLDTASFVNFVHIARDLIDHQYQPNGDYIYQLVPRKRRSKLEYPRRERLRSRVDAVVKYLKMQGCDDLVFVAHSQGSIIVFEYLKALQAIERASCIRVVTFGSPLSHLYSHYFNGYQNVAETLLELRRRGIQWVNLYRINDPIGNCIEGPEELIKNIAMPKGPNGEGHTNYWSEAAVGQEIRNILNDLQRKGAR
jgi:hypothetical protein